jgi:hypothetical protein
MTKTVGRGCTIALTVRETAGIALYVFSFHEMTQAYKSEDDMHQLAFLFDFNIQNTKQIPPIQELL